MGDLDEQFSIRTWNSLAKNVSPALTLRCDRLPTYCFTSILLQFSLLLLGIIGITFSPLWLRKKRNWIRKVLGSFRLSMHQSATKEYFDLSWNCCFCSLWPIAYMAANSCFSNFCPNELKIINFFPASIGLMTFAFTAVIVRSAAYQAAQANPVIVWKVSKIHRLKFFVYSS